MTDIKKLIKDGAQAAQLMEPGPARDLIAHLTDALEETHEVAWGADHTAAKYWRRMCVRDQDAHDAQIRAINLQAERDRFADDLVKTGEDADRYRAAIEEALAFESVLPAIATEPRRILTDALTDKEGEK